MNKFSEFEKHIENGKTTLKARLHSNAPTIDLNFTITQKEEQIIYKIGTLFEDPNPLSKVLKKCNSIRLFHATKAK